MTFNIYRYNHAGWKPWQVCMCTYTHTHTHTHTKFLFLSVVRNWKQWFPGSKIIPSIQSWFLNTIFHWEKSQLLREKANAKARVKKTQDKLGTFHCTKCKEKLKNNGDMSNVYKRALWSSHWPDQDITENVSSQRCMLKTALPWSQNITSAELNKGPLNNLYS